MAWLISKKTIIFQGSRGGPTFSRGGSNFFQVGSNCLCPIETHITCDFPGGGLDPLSPPMDLHLPAKIKGHWETGPLLVCFPTYFIVTVTCSCTNLRSVLSLYITYNVSVMLIGSVIIDNQSILT